jgi:hypothetical protein
MVNEEVHNLYSSLNVISIIKSIKSRIREYMQNNVEMRNVYKILVGKSE